MSDQHTNETRQLDLDAIEARARHWDHLVRDDPETTLALVAEVRRLRKVVESLEGFPFTESREWGTQ